MAGGRPEIIQGSDRTLNLTIRDSNGDPFDLTLITEITVCFKKEDETFHNVTLGGGKISITGNALLGKIAVALTDADTLLIAAGIKVDFKVILDTGAHPGGTRRVVRFDQQIDVLTGDC